MSSQNNAPQVSRISDPININQIIGYIKTVTTIPTYSAKTLDQGMRIYMDSLSAPTVKRLYIYSFEAGIWNYITLT